MGSVYEGLMIDCRHTVLSRSRAVATALSKSRAVAMTMLFGLGMNLGGCADMSETAMNAFADPAKYDMYDCKQLQDARKGLASRAAELQGLMAKAETGVAGSVVAEVAYRNDYIATRASSKLADEVWQRNKCVEIPDKKPIAAPSVLAPPQGHGRAKGAGSPPRSDASVY
jgi:hypothetical protein